MIIALKMSPTFLILGSIRIEMIHYSRALYVKAKLN